MAKSTRAQRESDLSIFKHLSVLIDRHGFDGAEKKLSELSQMALKDDIDSLRNSVIKEVCKVFDLQESAFVKGGHSSMNEARHQGLMILVAVLHGELGQGMRSIANFLDYGETNIYRKWYSFNALKRDSKVAGDREKLERYDKVVAALKAKKIIS